MIREATERRKRAAAELNRRCTGIRRPLGRLGRDGHLPNAQDSKGLFHALGFRMLRVAHFIEVSSSR